MNHNKCDTKRHTSRTDSKAHSDGKDCSRNDVLQIKILILIKAMASSRRKPVIVCLVLSSCSKSSRKNLTMCELLRRHCIPEFMKQVLPRLRSPTTPDSAFGSAHNMTTNFCGNHLNGPFSHRFWLHS